MFARTPPCSQLREFIDVGMFFYDATGKQGPGMVVGGLTQHGNYDECLNARHYHELEPKHATEVHRAQYCTAVFNMPVWMSHFVESLDVPYPVRLPQMTVDLCVPVTCSESDLHTVVSTCNAVFSVILLLVILGTCVDAISRLRKAEVVTGEVTQVGLQRQTSRLSRFRHSFLFHWHQIMGQTEGHSQHKPVLRRRATIGGYKPSIMRRVSNSLIRRRMSSEWDPKGGGGGGGGGEKDSRNEGVDESNSSMLPSEDSPGIQLRSFSQKLHNGDARKHKAATDKSHALQNGQITQCSPDLHDKEIQKTDASQLTDSATRNRSSSSASNTSEATSNKANTAPEKHARSSTRSSDEVQQGHEAEVSKTEENNNTKTPASKVQDRQACANPVGEPADASSDSVSNAEETGARKSGMSNQEAGTHQENTEEKSQSSPRLSESVKVPGADSGETKTEEQQDMNLDEMTAGHGEGDADITKAATDAEVRAGNDTKLCNPAEENEELKNPVTSDIQQNNSGTHTETAVPDMVLRNEEVRDGSKHNETGTSDNETTTKPVSAELNPKESNSATVTSSDSNEDYKAEIRLADDVTQVVLTKRHAEDDVDKQNTTSSQNSSSRPPVASLKLESEDDKHETKKHSAHDWKSDHHHHPHHDKPSSPPSSPRKSPKRTYHDMDDSLRRKMAASYGEEEAPPSPRTNTGSSIRSSLSSIPEETPEEIRKNMSSASLGNAIKNKTTSVDNDVSSEGVRLRARQAEQKAGEDTLDRPTKQQRRDLHAVESQEKPKKSRSLVAEILLCFSFLLSVRKVMAEGNADYLFSLNGVRVMSISWIVLGNTLSILYSTPAVLGHGCLVTYHFLLAKSKQLEEKKGKPLLTPKSVVIFYVHRLMRILPCYYVAILLNTVLLPYMGYGPRWTGTNTGIARCKDHWWANALLFSNFYKADEMCMPWTYYLVNDFQFYLLSPLVLYPLLYLPRLGLSLLVSLVATQIVSSSLLTNEIQAHGSMLSMDSRFFSEVYVKPYCRVGAYAVGMGLGYFLYSTNRQIYFRKLPLLLGWLSTLAVMGTLIYVTHTDLKEGGQPWTSLETALYEAVSRPLWSLGLAWVIFTLREQVPILERLPASMPHYIYLFVANLVCAYCLAFFLITLVESPFVKLEALLRRRLA
ncbi:hypothetical protein BaRGS_00022921 [Batillaria attramentaria]|uniref:Nose resistant-to-fluoxetine protein N-terminal domain-containing protein n=1 Tax=Batillaria attramentaria TaxID=370345 RepID=A0ABD0KFC6_9CAEN